MRVLLLIAFIGAAVARPQGYSYQVVPALGPLENNGFSSHQYQVLQQFAEQQLQQDQTLPQPQPLLQQVIAVSDAGTEDTGALSQTVAQSADSGLYQYASQSAGQVSGPQQHLPSPAETVTFEHEQHAPHTQDQPEQRVPSVDQPQQQPEPALPIELPQRNAFTHPAPSYEAPSQSVHYNKEFYYLSAPQEDNESDELLQRELDKMKKNLRVVFIRAPENNGITQAALQLAKQSLDSQTAIYVLSKQHDVAELANKLQDVRSASRAKPEVIFVKYKTPAEADQAQRTIQAQFEALEGPNTFNHEGVVPTHSFIGSAGSIDPRAGGGEKMANLPVSKYLPAVKRH